MPVETMVEIEVCPECFGTGFANYYLSAPHNDKECWMCNGMGEIAIDTNMVRIEGCPMDGTFVPWLRGLAEKGGKGVVNNIDARSLGRVADELERLQTAKRAALKVADERSKENVRLRTNLTAP